MSTTEPDRGSSLSIGGRIGNNPAPTICGAQGRTENETVTPNETCVECGSQVGLDAHDIVTCQNWHFQSAIGPATVVQRDAMDRYVVAASMYGNALLAMPGRPIWQEDTEGSWDLSQIAVVGEMVKEADVLVDRLTADAAMGVVGAKRDLDEAHQTRAYVGIRLDAYRSVEELWVEYINDAMLAEAQRLTEQPPDVG